MVSTTSRRSRAALDDLQEWVPRAFGPDVLRVHVVSTGERAAGVPVVTLDRRDQEQLAVGGEDGREHVEVGQVPATGVRVVGDEHVTGIQLAFEELQAEAHRERRRQHELGDPHRERGEPAAAVEDRRVAFVRLVQDRGRGGPRHERRHLEADRLHPRPDHLRGDRVEGRARRARSVHGTETSIS